MGFNNLKFSQRFQQMGDESEKIFEDWCTKHSINLVRLGLNRPPFKYFPSLPANIRYLPDYLIEDTDRVVRDNNGPMKLAHAFVEVKGVGRDQLIKIKLDTLDCNAEVEEVFERPVLYFIWDKIGKRVSFHHTLKDLLDIINTYDIPVKTFHEGNKYYPIPTKLLRWHNEIIHI